MFWVQVLDQTVEQKSILLNTKMMYRFLEISRMQEDYKLGEYLIIAFFIFSSFLSLLVKGSIRSILVMNLKEDEIFYTCLVALSVADSQINGGAKTWIKPSFMQIVFFSVCIQQ